MLKNRKINSGFMKGAIMKKILSFILAAALFAGVLPTSFADSSDISIDNDYIKAYVKQDGSAFGINTVKGVPAKRYDDNQPLLYDGDDKFATSYTTVRIIKNPGAANEEAADYVYGSSQGVIVSAPQVQQIDGENRAVVSQWAVDGVTVTQKIIINSNTASAAGGYADVEYSYYNANPAPVGVGIRILFDTKIASNDGGSFFVNGSSNAISRETEFEGDSVPEWFSVSDSVTYSTTSAYGLLKNSSMRRYPDKVQAAHWYNLANTLWDYSVNTGLNFDDYYNEYRCPDSAVSIMFNPELVASGESLSIDTMYGVGELSGTETSTDGCVLTVTQKEALYPNDDKSGYKNDGEITLYLTIDNSDRDSRQIVDGKVRLSFQDKIVDDENNMTQEPAVWVASEREEDEVISVGTINRGAIKRNIPIKLKARPVYEKDESNGDPDAPDIVYAPTSGYNLRTSIDTRKITMSLTGNGNPIPTVGSKVVTLPSLGDGEVDLAFTEINPKKIYYEGYSYFAIQATGRNFGIMTDKTNWTAYLTDIVSGDIINIDSFNCSVDTENKQLGLLVDMERRLGKFKLTIEFKNSVEYLGKMEFDKKSDYIETTSDEKYKNRGYSVAVIARTSENTDYEMALFTTETGKSLLGSKSPEEQYAEYKEKIEEKKGEMLLEARGVFKVLYKEGKDGLGEKGFVISTDPQRNNPDIIGFESVAGSDNVKLNRILYYNTSIPMTIKADFTSDGKPSAMRIEGDGDLSIINASTIWKNRFMIKLPMGSYFTYDIDDEAVASRAEAPKLQLLGGGWLLQNLGGFIFSLNYGVLGCQDGRYTIDFSGSVSFPLGMSKSEDEAQPSASASPSDQPSDSPSTAPTPQPSDSPSTAPTARPTARPSSAPTSASGSGTSTGTPPPQTVWKAGTKPTSTPIMTSSPTRVTAAPTTAPTAAPSAAPTTRPTTAPTSAPTTAPTTRPTTAPTSQPSASPSSAPTTRPTTAPSAAPTSAPLPSQAAAAARSKAKELFSEGNSSTKSLGRFGDGGSLGISIDSVLFGEHEDRKDEEKIITGFVGVAATVNLQLPKSVFPAGGNQNNDPALSNGAAASNPTDPSQTIVSASNSNATTAAGQNQNASAARAKNKGKLNSFSLGATFNTYEFNAGVDLGFGVGPISTAFRMSLAEMDNGKIMLDSIYLEIKGFTVPIVPGVSSLSGLGGGITDLASSINYNGDARPPVTVNVMAAFDIVTVMVMQCDMSVSGNGLSFSVTGAPKGFDQIKFVAKGEFDWTTGFTARLSGTVDMFSGVVKGNVSLALTTNPQFYLIGKISGSLNIPGLGTLAGVSLAITNKFISGGVRVFIFSGGFVYYYDSNNFRLLSGSEVDEIADIDFDSEELTKKTTNPNAPSQMSFLEAFEVPGENGAVTLMGIGAGTSVLETSVDRSVTSSFAGAAGSGGASGFDTNITRSQITGNDIVLRVYYSGDTAPQLSVTRPDGSDYPLVEYDYEKTQEENNALGANMLFKERENAKNGQTEKYAYISLYNPSLTEGKWSVKSTNGAQISDYTVLSVPTVTPKLSVDSASISGNILSASWTADDSANVTVSLVPSDENGKPVIESFTDENGNLIENEHPGYILHSAVGSANADIDINIPSGRYIVRLDSIVNNTMFTSAYTSEPLMYTNPNTLSEPVFEAVAGGDGRINIKSTVPENATGVQFNVYKRTENGSAELLGGIGGYVGDFDGKGEIETYFKGQNTVLGSDGETRYTSAIVPGETYFVEAYAVNMNEGSGYYSSERVRSTDITVPVPIPPQVKVDVVSYDAKSKTDDKSIPYLQITNPNFLISYEITNFGDAPNDEVTVRFDVDEKRYGDVLTNRAGESACGYAAFSLTDGDHFVDVIFTNRAGDVTVVTKKLSLDSIPADIKIEYPQNGSLYDPSVGIPIRLTTDDNAKISVYLDDVPVVLEKTVGGRDRVFEETIPVILPLYSHEVKIVAADKNGNTTTHIATVVNKNASKIGGIKIKAVNPSGTEATELTAVGVDGSGNELGIDISKDQLVWTLLSDPSQAALTVADGNKSAVVMRNTANPFSVMARLNVTGGESYSDIYDSGIVGAQSQSEQSGQSSGSGSGGGGGGASVKPSEAYPKEVLELIEKVRSEMSDKAEVKAYKMYSGIDSVSKQGGNTAFVAGGDISGENYIVLGTDESTDRYTDGLPSGGAFRSDIVRAESIKPIDKMLLDLEVKNVENEENLGIYRYSYKTGKWIYIGGSLDSARAMLSEYVSLGGLYAAIENPNRPGFEDIDGNWAKLYINSLAYAELVNGYEEGGHKYFMPQSEITRGEFVKILTAASGDSLEDNDVSMFEDADQIAEWAAPYAAAAYKAGWLKGSVTDTGIRANLSDRITRQDAMTLVYRVFFEGEKSSGALAFSDSSAVSEYAFDAVSYLTENGIVSGYEDGSLKPQSFLLREQISKILWISILK